MKKLRNRILAIVMTAALAATGLPALAYADERERDLPVSGTEADQVDLTGFELTFDMGTEWEFTVSGRNRIPVSELLENLVYAGEGEDPVPEGVKITDVYIEDANHPYEECPFIKAKEDENDGWVLEVESAFESDVTVELSVEEHSFEENGPEAGGRWYVYVRTTGLSNDTFDLINDIENAGDDKFKLTKDYIYNPYSDKQGLDYVWEYDGDGTIDLNGHTIKCSEVSVTGDLTVTDNSQDKTGKICSAVSVTGTFGLHGGTITGSPKAGVSLGFGSLFRMNGGTITGNAGGVDCGEGYFVMRGGSIKGNNGIGVSCDYVSDPFTNSNFYFGDGKVVENGFGIFDYNVSGTVTVINELTETAAVGLAGSEGYRNVEEYTCPVVVGCNGRDYPISLDPYEVTKADCEHFSCDSIYEDIYIDEATASDDVYYFIIKNRSGFSDLAQLASWLEETDDPEETYTLEEDCILNDSIDEGVVLKVKAGRTAILDLNGHSIDYRGAGEDPVIEVRGNLTVCDSSEDGTGRIMGGHGGICVDYGGELHLKDAKVTGNTGYGIDITSGGKLYLGSNAYVQGNLNEDGEPCNVVTHISDARPTVYVEDVLSDRASIGFYEPQRHYNYAEDVSNYYQKIEGVSSHSVTREDCTHLTPDERNVDAYAFIPDGEGGATIASRLLCLKDELENASEEEEAPTVITLDMDIPWGPWEEFNDAQDLLVVPKGRFAILDLNGHVLNRCGCTGVYGNLTITCNGEDGSGKLRDAGFKVYEGGELTVTDGTICYNSSSGIIVSGGTVNLKGGTIRNNGENGISGTGGTVNLKGGTIRNNDDCGIRLSGGAVNMSGGCITENTGCGIYADTVEISGGCITENTGWGIYADTVEISGGTISDSFAGVWGRIVTVSGGIIEDNKDTGDTLSYYVSGLYADESLTMSGSPVIRNNYDCDEDHPDGVRVDVNVPVDDDLYTELIFISGPMGEGAEVWVDHSDDYFWECSLIGTGEEGEDPYELTASDVEKFHVDSDKYGFVYEESTHSGVLKDVSLWTDLKRKLADTSETAPSVITLTEDIVCKSGVMYEDCLVVPDGREVTIDLNGHTIDRGLGGVVIDEELNQQFITQYLTNADFQFNLVHVSSGGKLTIKDSSDAKSGSITGAPQTVCDFSDRRIVRYTTVAVDYDGEFVMEGGTLRGNSSGYGIFSDFSGSGEAAVTISGGKICDYECGIYGALNVAMSDGTVSDNFVGIGSQNLSISGGTITGNNVGVLYEFSISGGKISGNESAFGSPAYGEKIGIDLYTYSNVHISASAKIYDNGYMDDTDPEAPVFCQDNLLAGGVALLEGALTQGANLAFSWGEAGDKAALGCEDYKITEADLAYMYHDGGLSFEIDDDGNAILYEPTGIVLTSEMVSDIADQTYTGSEITPQVKVTYEGKTLTKGTDYTISYMNNVNAGNATAVVAGMGEYAGRAAKAFTINPKKLSDNMITLTPDVFEVPGDIPEGTVYEPVLTVRDGDRNAALVNKTDFTINGSSVLKASDFGTYTVTLNGAGNYDGTASAAWSVRKVQEHGNEEDTFVISEIEPQTYTGSAITPEPVILYNGSPLVKGEDYTLSYKNNVNAAAKNAKKAPTVFVKGKGSFTKTMSIPFDIVKRSIGDDALADCFSAEIADKQYTGKKAQSKPVIRFDNGSKMLTLKENRDYTLSYSPEEPKDAGEVSVTVTGKGNYEGSAVLRYSVIGIGTELKNAVVTTVSELEYTGEPLCPEVTVFMSKTDNTVIDPSLYTVEYKNNINAGKATVTVHGTDGHGELWKTVTFKITARPAKDQSGNAQFTLSLDDEADLTYTGKKLCPKVVVKDGEEVIPASAYKLTWSNTVNAFDLSTASADAKKVPTVTVKFKGNYSGTLTKKFSIDPMVPDTEDLVIKQADIKDKGKTIGVSKLKTTVKLGRKTLKKGKDYTLSFTRDPEKEIQSAEVILTGNYSGTAGYNFRIYGKDSALSLNGEGFTAVPEYESTVYDGTKKTPAITVTAAVDGITITLVKGRDYKVTYTDNTKAAQSDAVKAPKWTVTGIGAYKGTKSGRFIIEPKELNTETCEIRVADIRFKKGTARKPKVTVIDKESGKTLKLSRDYTLTYSNNTALGEPDGAKPPTVKVTGKGSYLPSSEGKESSAAFRIYAKEISSVTVVAPKKANYTGAQVKPEIKVYADKKKKVLLDMYSAENPDGKYVIEYGTNTATGTGTYTVIGVGEYGGKKSGRFSILSRILKK